MRPMIARTLAAHRKRGKPAPLAAPPQGPHAQVIQAFDGSPIAIVLRQVLDEMWASPILTRRCKGLLFAVVAQGLGCPLSTAAAQQVLLDEGLESDEIRQILTHLDAPALTPTERTLLGFARETIWYQPAPFAASFPSSSS